MCWLVSHGICYTAVYGSRRSPFLASNLGWCVKQDFLTLILSSSAAVYGSFEVVREGAISNESYSETSVRFLLCSKGSFYVFE